MPSPTPRYTPAEVQRVAQVIREACWTSFDTGTRRFSDRFRDEFQDNLLAVVAYGSSQTRPGRGALYDFYLIVEELQRAYGQHRFGGRRPALLELTNRALPPNIFPVQIRFGGETLLGKINVVSLEQLTCYTALPHPDIYLSGRFSKVLGVVHGRDAEVRRRIHGCMARSFVKHSARVLSLLPSSFTAEEYALEHIRIGYRSDVRVESPAKPREIFDADRAGYLRIAETLLDIERLHGRITGSTSSPDSDANPARFNRAASPSQRWLHRTLTTLYCQRRKHHSLLRTAKSLYTYDAWYPYALQKIEHATGQRLDQDHRLRSAVVLLARHLWA